MGEVEAEQQNRVRLGWRGALATWLVPDYMDQLLKVEEEAYGIALNLQRANQQLKGLMQDTGQYHDRWSELASGDYNPDTIGIAEYKKMLDYDAQVLTGWDLIEMGVLMKPWKIVHPDEEIVKTLTRALDQLQGPDIREAMKQMMKAVAYGFSVTEIVFDDYKGKYWMPRKKNGLKTLDPETIRFFSDAWGNLLKVEQWNMSTFARGYGTSRRRQGSVGGGIVLPLDRCIVWTHDREWGNYYGKAILKGCYKNWFIKDAMLKFANIAYERFGSPLLLGVSSTAGGMATMAETILRLYARSQAVIRKTDEKDPTDIRVIESKRTEMPFDRYIRYHDEMILRRMLIGQKMFEGGGGVYGAKVPLDLLMMRLEDIRREEVSAMNRLLIMITDLNWLVDVYPKFEFAPLTSMDQQQIMRSIYEAIDRGIIEKDEPFVRQQLNFPAKAEKTETETKQREEGE